MIQQPGFQISTFSKMMAIALLVICILISFRIYHTGSIRYVFILWNLFLAWIPYGICTYFDSVKNDASWKKLLLFGTWLLFLPNAFYLVTDLIHLRAENDVPVWFDASILFSASFVGLLLGYVSILKSMVLIKNRWPQRWLAGYQPFILFISSFGVYLGRFERWNSWDIVHTPFALLHSILQFLINPYTHYRVWLITVVLFLVYGSLYLLFMHLPQIIQKENHSTTPSDLEI